MRLFGEGIFTGHRIIPFPARKEKKDLEPALGYCAYCDRTHDERVNVLTLTSEHIIADALGCGIELPAASCAVCQKVTAEFNAQS